MPLDGFQLDLPNGDTFRASAGVAITHQTEPLFLIDGLRNFITLYNEFFDNQGGQPGSANSNFSGVFAGFGAGIHTIQVEFIQFEGNTESWGDAAAGDSAVTKLQELNRKITTVKTDSENPATLQVGEYATGENYNPLKVVIGSTDLTFDPGEQSSDFRGTVEFYESNDLGEAIDALNRVG